MSIPAAFVGVILIWSTTPLAIQWSSEGWGFMFGAASRMAIGALVCLIILYVMRNKLPWHKKAFATYIAAGIGVYGAMFSVYWGAQYIPSGLIAVLFGLSPMATAFMAAIWLNERSLTVAKLFAASLGVFGVYVIFQADFSANQFAWQGILAILMSVFLHTFSSVWVKKIGADISGLAITSGALLLVVPLYFLTWLLFSDNTVTHTTVRASVSTVYLGVFGSVIGFSLYFYVLKHMQASKVALITLITPILALFIGEFINGEQVSPTIWLGTVLIITALIVHQWGDNVVRGLVSSD